MPELERKDLCRVTLQRMHRNYSEAACTLVHDKELIAFEWKEDGSPCLALVLSTWFTRGWTALELRKSKSVKVLFRDPNPNARDPIIKDLDDDILAKEHDFSVHPAHRVASIVIQRVRGKWEYKHWRVAELLSALKPRYTSWARDRMIIAGLMADVKDFNPEWSKSEITKAILKNAYITGSALLHGQITMCNSGPWSWCPVSVLDLNEDAPVTLPLKIDRNGAVTGRWRSRLLNDREVPRHLNSHISIILRIEAALREKEKCLLLSPVEHKGLKGEGRCLLVINLREKRLEGNSVIQCRYIGTVVASYDGEWPKKYI